LSKHAIPEPFSLEHAGIRLAVYRWGEPPKPGHGRPALLMSHGTGFCAAVWQSVAESLAADFVVYAIDMRGHGASSKPASAYHFADFAADITAIIDELQLSAAYAIGHSAGATDLLLAAVERPNAFRSIFAMEPTMLVAAMPGSEVTEHDERLETAKRKRAKFASYDDAFEHYRTRGIFRGWQPKLLRAYVCYAFESQPDGSVSPLCTPEIELAILTPIVQAMAGTYRGDARGNPFDALDRVRCPTLITTTERSLPIFKHMAEAAKQRIPHASPHQFEDVGHCVAQVQPDAVAALARRFWAEAGSTR
jgi:pimeloyl-ACP methyl ester carboxylesterase